MQNRPRVRLRQTHDRRHYYDALLLVLGFVGLFAMIWASAYPGIFGFVLALLAFIGELLLIKGVFIDPNRLTIRRYRERLVAEPQTWLRVVWLSDLHGGGFRPSAWYQRIAEETRSLKPDIVVFGGDFVVDFVEGLKDLEPLRSIQARYGTYFLLGNHDLLDKPDEVRKFFGGMGAKDMENQSFVLKHEEREIEIAGVADHWYADPRLPARASASLPRLLLSHEPDVMLDLKEGEVDLVICGHTHGGQIRLPIVGALWPIPSALGRAVDMGRKVMHGIPLIISNGLGESDGRLRLGALPEIVVVEIGI